MLSDLTKEQFVCNDTSTSTKSTSNNVVQNIGDRKIGSTEKAIKEKEKFKVALVTKCAIAYQEKKNEAKKAGLANVPNGTLRKIVNEEEEKSGLSILLDTVRSRVKRGNLSAYNKNQQSSTLDIEPSYVNFAFTLEK